MLIDILFKTNLILTICSKYSYLKEKPLSKMYELSVSIFYFDDNVLLTSISYILNVYEWLSYEYGVLAVLYCIYLFSFEGASYFIMSVTFIKVCG